jgi:xanthine dehydrogenase accessory factor
VGDLLVRWHAALEEQSPVAVATVIEGPGVGGKVLVSPEDHIGSAGNDDLDRAIIEAARGMLEGGRTGTIHLGPRGQRSSSSPSPRRPGCTSSGR